MTHTQTQGADGAGTFDHEFKSHPDVFWPAARGEKTFEYRRDDRGGYEVGQTVRLHCYDLTRGYHAVPPLDRRITNILRGGEFELPQGYCILSLAPLADGAGTKTAKPGDLLYRSEWETKRTITHEDAREIAGRLIASRFRRTDCETARASIPANPDYDDDLLINSYIKQQARKDAALAAPAPAATPGVPDSLRALSEAATQGRFKAIRSVWGFILVAEEGDPKGCLNSADADFAVAAVNHIRALIAAQPAGQACVPDSVRALSEKIKSATLYARKGGFTRSTLFLTDEESNCILAALITTHPAAQNAATGAGPCEDDITSAMIQAGRYAANLNDGTLARIYLAMRTVEWEEARAGDKHSETALAASPIAELKPCPWEEPHLCCYPKCTCAKDRETDHEIDRILAMSGNELHAELVAEGHDPDALVRQMKQGLDGTLRLAADRDRWRTEAGSWRRVAERLEEEKRSARDSTRTGAAEAHAVFDPARTTSDPYDDRPGPWYDMKKVREIEAATGIAFASVHPERVLGRDTDGLVEGFAVALGAKLRAAEAKYGWQNGWLKDDWAADCQRELMRHVGKGDPLDVAAYAAFCWHHGWPTAPSSTCTGAAEIIARAAYVRICRHDSKEGWQEAGDDFDRREEDGGCYANALELALAIGADAAAALPARPEAPSDAGWRERVRHVKRGTEYEVLGEAEMQVAVSTGWRHFPTGVDLGDAIPARLTHDGCKVTVYRGSDGKLWCRFTNEFRDGRFETITPPSDPAPSGQAEG